MPFQKGNKLAQGLKRSTKTRKQISDSLRGRYTGKDNPMYGKKHSLETRMKMRLNHPNVSGDKNPNFGKHLSIEAKQRISEANKNKTPYWLGKKRPPFSDEWKTKMVEAHRGKRMGSENPAWKGGVTPTNRNIRTSSEYKEWRKAVFERDNYTCKNCKARNGNGIDVYLEAHHIRLYSTHPELRFDVSNGRTLCLNCHRNIHK